MALTYPAFLLVLQVSLPASYLLSSLVWGLATTLLPWFVLFPAFGWGLFGVRAPKGTRPVLLPTISHLLYGLALGIVLTVAAPPGAV